MQRTMQFLILIILGIQQAPSPARPPSQTDLKELVFFLAAISAIATLLAMVIWPFLKELILWVKAGLDQRKVMKRLGVKFHPGLLNKDGFRYFVRMLKGKYQLAVRFEKRLYAISCGAFLVMQSNANGWNKEKT
jgi:hypothetical protein